MPTLLSALKKIRWLGAAHPEWWVLVLSAAAWFFLLYPGLVAACCILPTSGSPSRSLFVGWFDWLIMVLAMMLPLMLVPVRFTAFASLWRRRHWAMAAFLCGYVGIWTAAGIVLLFVLILLRGLTVNRAWLAAIGLLLAAAWQITPLKRRCSAACHLTRPLRPVGWQANFDCLSFGGEHAVYCMGNCGVLMFAAMLSPFHRTMMIAATLILAYERYRARPRERSIPLSLGLLAAGHLL